MEEGRRQASRRWRRWCRWRNSPSVGEEEEDEESGGGGGGAGGRRGDSSPGKTTTSDVLGAGLEAGEVLAGAFDCGFG